jgi:hypothetical protein
MTVLVTVAAVAGAMALVLSIAIARMDVAEARRREVSRGRSCWAQDPLPTWEDAVAHAETLRERGVDVSIDERLKWILIRGTDGERHDPDDGTPASQCFYSDGTPEWVEHYTNGYRHDPADGTPASQGFHPDGTPMWIAHYTNGYRHDPADGTPAYRTFYPDGTPKWISHCANDELVSEESFGPRS